MVDATPEERRHWSLVAALGCILTGQEAEIAHCHGGSMRLLGPEWQPGMGQRQSHWLVLPLNWRIHRGPQGLDTWGEGVEAWETKWKTTQLKMLAVVSEMLGYNVFDKAGVGRLVQTDCGLLIALGNHAD